MSGDNVYFRIHTLRADLFGVLFKIFNKNPRPYDMRVVPREGKLCPNVILKQIRNQTRLAKTRTKELCFACYTNFVLQVNLEDVSKDNLISMSSQTKSKVSLTRI